MKNKEIKKNMDDISDIFKKIRENINNMKQIIEKHKENNEK